MAAPSVTVDVARIAEAEIIPDTGTWGNDGGGGGVADEVDIVYQGSASQSRKVGTSLIGRDYTHGSGTDMDGDPSNRRHVIMKVLATNYGALLARTAPGMPVKIGSGSSDYHEYHLFGNDNYPARGGFQIIAIAPSVSGYASAVGDTGTPNDSAILYWSLLGDFNTTSVANNLIIDAIDVGLGLFLVGGDGASTDAVFQDFVDFDEGTVANRYGFVVTESGVLFVNGRLTIGETSSGTVTHTDFTDSGITVVWQNGLVRTGFHRLRLNLGDAGTVLTLTNCSFGSVGQIDNDGDRGYTSTEDSRPIFDTLGNLGLVLLKDCVFDNFAQFSFSSGVTLDGAIISNCGQLLLGSVNGGSIQNSRIAGYTGAANTSAVVWDAFLGNPTAALTGTTFTAHPSVLSHAISFGTSTPTTINLTDIDFIGYSTSNNVNDSVLHIKRTSGTVTINVSGGSGVVSYRTDGATVNVVNSVSVTVNVKDAVTFANIENARVVLRAASGGPEPFEDSVTIATSGTTATVTHTAHGLVTGNKVEIRGANEQELLKVATITVTDVDTYTYTIASIGGASGTGSINSTFVVIASLTDSNGNATNSGYNYSSDQPVGGRARKNTTEPFYKTCPLTGTITSGEGGLNLSCLLALD